MNRYLNENQEVWRRLYIKLLRMNDLGPNADYKNLVKLYYQPIIQIIEKNQLLKEVGDVKFFMADYINDNGSMILGSAKTSNGKTAFRIKDKEFKFGLLNSGRWSRACSANPDNSIIVGFACDGANKNIPTAVRYTEDGNPESLGLLNHGNLSRALKVDCDGMIYGIANDGNEGDKPKLVVWKNGIIEIINENCGDNSVHVTDLNFNGFMVGYLTDHNKKGSERAFKITKDDIFHLEEFEDRKVTYALSTNVDSSIIGGYASKGGKKTEIAVIWDKKGVYSVDSYFKRLQLIAPSEVLNRVEAVSNNGSEIIGSTKNGNIFKAHIPIRL